MEVLLERPKLLSQEQAEMPLMTIEEEMSLELDALMGSFADNQEAEKAKEERRLIDAQIMEDIKSLLTTAEGLGNVRLVEDMGQKLAEMACNHDHFAQQLDKNNIEIHKEALKKLQAEAQQAEKRESLVDKLLSRRSKDKKNSKDTAKGSFLSGMFRIKLWFLPE